LEQIREQFLNPPDEFTPVPFWFWNDRLEKDEILRQIRDFHEKGVMGFVLHPRMGIPDDIPYMSDIYLDLVEAAVTEAERLGMIVFLYDEAMYPSGSANGQVVKGNPEFASRGLLMKEYPVSGHTEIKLELAEGETAVSVQAVRKTGEGQYLPGSAVVLPVEDGRILFNAPDNGEWVVLAFVEGFSGGHIRGIHFGEDDGEPNAPASADLLNPAAVRKFIRLTHDKYYGRLSRFFGRTIQAVFTDEPDILGRGRKKGMKPWTGGFLARFTEAGCAETDLPGLWWEAGPETERIRRTYRKAVNRLLSESYYRPLYQWCEDHGVALTGHPAASDDIGLLDDLQIPGQDVVWRWVAPEDDKGLTGVHSTMAKCSSDAARHRGRRRNLNECFGVCGRTNRWDFTADDMKWYMDWLFVRGVNLLSPHAFYYSIEGERRRGERPPDVGPNNIWWPHYRIIAQYIKRMSWLMTDVRNTTPVAVLCEEDYLPWALVRPLFESQVEFNYLEEELLLRDAVIREGAVRIREQAYRAVLVEDWNRLEGPVQKLLQEFACQGGVVISGGAADGKPAEGICRIAAPDEVTGALDRVLPRELRLEPAGRGIRASHVVKGDVHLYVLVNESEEPYAGRLKIPVIGRAEKWDPWHGTAEEQAVKVEAGNVSFPVTLMRRESVVYCIDPSGKPLAEETEVQPVKTVSLTIDGWRVAEADVPAENVAPLRSWTERDDMKGYSGTVVYEAELNLDEANPPRTVTLDLGAVGEIAELRINGQYAGTAMWSPYVFDISAAVKPGINRLSVRISNSLSNSYGGVTFPSGLIGPVTVTLTPA